jgi:hypothetical protein
MKKNILILIIILATGLTSFAQRRVLQRDRISRQQIIKNNPRVDANRRNPGKTLMNINRFKRAERKCMKDGVISPRERRKLNKMKRRIIVS